MKTSHITNALCCICLFSSSAAFAGTAQKWDDIPPAVQKTVLANGGTVGMTVDLEKETANGQAIYEAGVKAKDGTIHDVVVTADGKLVEIKTDDGADAAQERIDRATAVLKGVTFSNPRQITNPYLPLASVTQDILEGKEEGKAVRIERVSKPDVHKTFNLSGQSVESLAFEDRAYENNKLVEVAIDYFAQDDAGRVYYLGEEVDEYENGKITGHDGSWIVGKDTPAVGVLFPAKPAVGMRWRSEDVSGNLLETDEIVSVSEKVVTQSGTYLDCIKVKEIAPNEVEYKYYAKGVGVVREQPPEGDELLVSHKVIEKK